MTLTETMTRAARRPKLADRVADEIGGAIRSGKLKAGEKLPTEQRLTISHGVSRTVIREAVARLAADGLVTARQGAGVYVNEAQPTLGAMLAEITSKVSVVLNVLEVRMAIEMESAALAAHRRSASQEADIVAAFAQFDEILGKGEPTGAADFAFHRAIATATNNPFYVEILDALGRRTIPRDLVTTVTSGLLRSPEYQRRLQDEHRVIVDAVRAGDAAAARDAMRAHLSAAQRRYQALLRGGGQPPPAA